MPTPRSLSPTAAAGLTEVVDIRRGAIRASGHLTVQGADLLRGTVETLYRDGHSTVRLDLQGLRAVDEAGLRVLRNVQQSIAARGGELFLVAPPAHLA